MSGVRLKVIGDRMGISYCDTTQRIGAALRNARISGVKFNAQILETDIELEQDSDNGESLGADLQYSEFQTASELDTWFNCILESRGVLGDIQELRNMLRSRVEKLIATKFTRVCVNGPKSCWPRLYLMKYSKLEAQNAEYYADLPHMIASTTTLMAGSDGMTQRGFVLVRVGAKLWHMKENATEDGIPVTGEIRLRQGDFLADKEHQDDDEDEDDLDVQYKVILLQRYLWLFSPGTIGAMFHEQLYTCKKHQSESNTWHRPPPDRTNPCLTRCIVTFWNGPEGPLQGQRGTFPPYYSILILQ